MSSSVSEAEAPEGFAHEQALHLGGIGVVAVVQRAQCAAAGHGTIDLGQQDVAARCSVVAGQVGDLGMEILKLQVDVQAGGVLQKDLADFVHVFQVGRRQQGHSRLVHGQSAEKKRERPV
jgi:hypothetical protein